MQLVSVIMPTYNSVHTMQEALDSLKDQTHRPIEIITIDDASEDGSYAFAKAYSQQHTAPDFQFITLSNPVNVGAGVSRNNALNNTTGDYIAFLDADDLWKPRKLEMQLAALKEHNATVCYGAYELFKTHPDNPIAIQKVFEKLSYSRLHKANYLGNLTGLYHAAAIGKIPIPALRKRQDWAMWLEVVKKGGDAIGIQEPIASYRLGNGLSSNKWDLVSYNYAVYRTHLKYSAVKSMTCMIRFFYEQFTVKSTMKIKV